MIPPLIPAIAGAWCLMHATDVSDPLLRNAHWIGASTFIICFVVFFLKREEASGAAREVGNRAAEVVLLMAAGYSNDWVVKLHGVPVGWVAACVALLSEFIRGIGGARSGVFAAPLRMAFLALGTLGCMFEPFFRQDGKVEATMQAVLTLIILGSAVTCWQRLAEISKDSSKKPDAQS
jgi:hypothetical protein